jgi:GcrA cell cycle regulator
MSNPDNFIWTDTDVEKLVALHLKGLSAREIGARFNVTRNAVIGKLSRLKAAGKYPELGEAVLLSKKHHQKITSANILKSTLRRENPRPAPKPIPKPKPVLKLVQKPVEVAPVTEVVTPMGDCAQPLHNLRRKGCKWIAESPPKGSMDDALMCGELQHENSPYCPYHRKIALYPMTPTERAKAAQSIIRAGTWNTARKRYGV